MLGVASGAGASDGASDGAAVGATPSIDSRARFGRAILCASYPLAGLCSHALSWRTRVVVVRTPASRDADIGTRGAPLERPASLRTHTRTRTAMEPSDPPATTDDPARPVALAILVAVFGALVAQQAVCAEQHVCLKHGTCFAVRDASYSCAFRTSVTPAGARMLNLTSQDAALASLQRGVCAPGLRLSLTVDGQLRCTRRRNFPDAMAYDAEATNADAAMPDHERHCKKWIDAEPLVVGEERFSFFDQRDLEDDVERVLLAGGSGRLAVSDVSKFRTACRSMIVADAAGPATTLAYEHLQRALAANFDLTHIDDLFRAVGFLASHFCDAPATVGLAYDAHAFAVGVDVGFAPHAAALNEALYAVGVARATRERASAFAELIDNDDDSDGVIVDADEAQKIVEGSYRNGWLESEVLAAGAPPRTTFAAENPPLARFLRAARVRTADAAPYVHALAAFCVVSGRSTIAGEFGGLSLVEDAVRELRSSQPEAAALGRLKSSDLADRFVHAHSEHVLNASRTTWSALAASRKASMPITAAVRPSARSVCLRAARVAFPDAFDGIGFNQLVTSTLYNRLETATERLREAAIETIQAPLIGNLYATTERRAEAVDQLRSTHVRIAGAPSGTWAGVATSFVRPSFRSDDGAILMLLKQARAVYFDRLARAVRQASMCEHPPLFDGLERNAYLLLSRSFSCVMLLPGLLVPPFADERYDDASLYARAGYVLAHEMMHVTAHRADWNEAYASYLLYRYDPVTYLEAIADVGALAALMRLGVVTNSSLCGHLSQIWCARIGWLSSERVAVSHPLSNNRGDHGCAFLRAHFS